MQKIDWFTCLFWFGTACGGISCTPESSPWIVNAAIAGNAAGDTYIAAYVTGCSCEDKGVLKERQSDGTFRPALGWEHWLVDVWVSDTGDVYAVSDSPYIAVKRDGAWNKVMMTEGAALMGVWGTATDDVFLVGDQGRVVHYDGTNWRDMETPVNTRLQSMWGSAPDDVFAVGKAGTIIHFDGDIWESMDSTTDANLSAIWGASQNDIYAVGGSEETSNFVIVHFDGTEWSVVEEGGPFHLIGIDGTASDDIVAVGGDSIDDTVSATLLRFDGIEWREQSTGIHEFLWDARILPNGDTIVVGPNDTIETYR